MIVPKFRCGSERGTLWVEHVFAPLVEKVSTWGKGWRQISDEEPRKMGQTWIDVTTGETEEIKAFKLQGPTFPLTVSSALCELCHSVTMSRHDAAFKMRSSMFHSHELGSSKLTCWVHIKLTQCRLQDEIVHVPLP